MEFSLSAPANGAGSPGESDTFLFDFGPVLLPGESVLCGNATLAGLDGAGNLVSDRVRGSAVVATVSRGTPGVSYVLGFHALVEGPGGRRHVSGAVTSTVPAAKAAPVVEPAEPPVVEIAEAPPAEMPPAPPEPPKMEP